MTIYLYKKTHNITGLKYLGKTKSKDPHKYTGSGKYWTTHSKVHGKNYSTEILKECHTAEEIKYWGIYYSKLWNVVESEDWANLTIEDGSGGRDPGFKCTEEHRKNNALARLGKKLPQEQIDKAAKSRTGLKRTEEFKNNHSQLAKEKGWRPPVIDSTNQDYDQFCKKVSEGVSKSWEQRRLSGTASGKFIWINDGSTNKKIRSTDIILNGWCRGRLMLRDRKTGKFIKRKSI